jgi:ubiquinone/menaquinone biosynthesis C-methylase UbiE
MAADEEPVVINWADKAERLGAAVADDAAWYAEMAAALVEPGDRVAVDVGCGGAGMAVALSRALSHDALIVGVDGDDTVLAAAHRAIAEAGVADDRIELVRAGLDDNLSALPGVAEGADVVWASASIHHVGDQQAAIDQLAALLAPGGRLALAEGGLPKRHLPWDLGIGEPGLEVRLLAADDRWFAKMRAALPGSVRMPYGWTTALREAGLTEITTRTTIFEKPAPLAGADLDKVLDSVSHRVDRANESGVLDAEDATVWARLLDAEDVMWIGRRDDVYSLTARCVHRGRYST